LQVGFYELSKEDRKNDNKNEKVQVYHQKDQRKAYGPDFPKVVQKEYVYAYKENKE
jgi:hypothetical protein